MLKQPTQVGFVQLVSVGSTTEQGDSKQKREKCDDA